MRKKIILSVLGLLVIVGGYIGFKFFGPAVSNIEAKYIYIKNTDNVESVKKQILDKHIISNGGIFDQVAKRLNYKNPIKPGRYEVKDGMSMYNLVKMLNNGSQAPVNFTITKLRTVQDLASRMSKYFETDSANCIRFLLNIDSLRQYNLDSNTVMTAVIPNTYSIYWNSTPAKIFKKLFTEQEKFWTEERKTKASAIGLTPKQVYALASIVEEETLKDEDKGKIASVYLNRIETGMKLEADPTLKFALKNFGLTRILNVHKDVVSPYNTYKNAGIPPGPICTPSSKTIDAVLNAPSTNYLFFVAKPGYGGYSNFAATYAEHQIYAKAYQDWLTEEQKAKRVK